MSSFGFPSPATPIMPSPATNTLIAPDLIPKQIGNHALVGAVIGGILGIILLPLAVAVMVWYTRRRRKAPERLDEHRASADTVPYTPPRINGSQSNDPLNSPINSPSTPSFLIPRKHSNPFTDSLCEDNPSPNHRPSLDVLRVSEATLPPSEMREISSDGLQPCDTPTNADNFDDGSCAGTQLFDLDDFPAPPTRVQAWSNSSMA